MADIAMLVPDPGSPSTNLGLLISRVEGLGHTVNLFVYNTPPDDTGLLANDAVVISPLGFSEPVQDGFWDCPLPILAHGRMGHNTRTLGMADRGDPSSGSDGATVEYDTIDGTTEAAYEGLRGSYSLDTDIVVATASIGGRNLPVSDLVGDTIRIIRHAGTGNRWGVAAAEGVNIGDFTGGALQSLIASPSNRAHYPSPDSTGDYDLLNEDGWQVFVDLPLAWLDLGEGAAPPTHVRTIRQVSQSGTLT